MAPAVPQHVLLNFDDKTFEATLMHEVFSKSTLEPVCAVAMGLDGVGKITAACAIAHHELTRYKCSGRI